MTHSQAVALRRAIAKTNRDIDVKMTFMFGSHLFCVGFKGQDLGEYYYLTFPKDRDNIVFALESITSQIVFMRSIGGAKG